MIVSGADYPRECACCRREMVGVYPYTCDQWEPADMLATECRNPIAGRHKAHYVCKWCRAFLITSTETEHARRCPNEVTEDDRTMLALAGDA